MSAFSRLPVPFLHPVNGSGTPYPGAKAYFYTAGTTTPLDTYSDKDLSVPNANPVVADANGLFGQIFLGSGTYDVLVTTSTGTTIWTAEDVAAAAVSNATTTVAGIIELATTAEALTGSSAVLGMTPATVAAAIQQGFSYGTTGGSANAITVTPTILPSALSSGMAIYFRASSTNTAATTINYAGLGVVSAKVLGPSGPVACAGGEIVASNTYRAVYSGSDTCWLVSAEGGVPAELQSRTEDTSPDWAADWVDFFDVSAKLPKKVKLSSLVSAQADLETPTSTAQIVPPGRMNFHPGVAKCRVQYDQSSGTATVQGVSYNLSSVTDGAAGLCTINMTTAMSSAFYHIAGITQRPSTNNDAVVAINTGVAPTTTAFQLATTVAAVNVDMSWVSAVAHGDQ